MLSENIKNIRRQNGLTQEAFAIRLNVVRQTVSKWEKGLSVPDAQMLQRIADEFEVPVQSLLGSEPAETEAQNSIADQLAKINEQLAVKNRRSSNIWKGVCLALVLLVGFLAGKLFAGNRETVQPQELPVLPEVLELTGVSFSGNSKELVCSFVPSFGNETAVYTVTMHCTDPSVADAAVTAQYENGICTAVFQKAKLAEFAEYTVVLSVACSGEVRNGTVAEFFHFSDTSYVWQG